MPRLRIGFAATPQIAANLLNSILSDDSSTEIEVKFVLTQPDRPVGRAQVLTASPVKQLALRNGIDVLTNLKSANERLEEIDLMLVFAYGELIPRTMIEAVKLGFWNIHLSLLPQYRGASPTAYSLLLGDSQTGTTLMKIDEELDHGGILAQDSMPVSTIELRDGLEDKLTQLSFELLKKTLSLLTPEFVLPTNPQEQNHDMATFTRLLQKDDGYIPLSVIKNTLANGAIQKNEIPRIITEFFEKNKTQDFTQWVNRFSSSQIIFNLYRGLSPWPGIWTTVTINEQEKRLKILKMSLENDRLMINTVQLEGKNEVDFATFNFAYKIF